MGFPDGSLVKNLPAMQKAEEMQVQLLGQEEPLDHPRARGAREAVALLGGASWSQEVVPQRRCGCCRDAAQGRETDALSSLFLPPFHGERSLN